MRTYTLQQIKTHVNTVHDFTAESPARAVDSHTDSHVHCIVTNNLLIYNVNLKSDFYVFMAAPQAFFLPSL